MKKISLQEAYNILEDCSGIFAQDSLISPELSASGDRKTGVVLPCDTVKNSVFVIEFPLEDEKE